MLEVRDSCGRHGARSTIGQSPGRDADPVFGHLSVMKRGAG